MDENNFILFNKTELNLDLTEIHISFSDCIILKGVSNKYENMNAEF